MSAVRAPTAPPRGGGVLRGASAEAEGDRLVQLRRQTHREKAASAGSQVAKVRAIFDDPHLYGMAEAIDAFTSRDRALGGRPRKHPTWVLVGFGQCLEVYGSASATERAFADPDLWKIVIGASETWIDAGEALPATGPSRDQWQYFLDHRVTPHQAAITDLQRTLNLKRAKDLGLLDKLTASLNDIARPNVVVVDGKVFSSPVGTLAEEELPARQRQQGRKRREIKRPDPGRALYAEGGSDKRAWGTKFAIVSVRAPMSNIRVPLAVEYIPHRGGGGEGQAFIDVLTDVGHRATGIAAFVADGALRGKHIAEIQQATGSLMISPPRRRGRKHGGVNTGGPHGMAAVPLPPSKARRRVFKDCSGHDLIASTGTVYEVVRTFDGSQIPEELERSTIKRERLTNGRFALRVHMQLACRETGEIHTWWESLTPTRDDVANEFNRSEYLRGLPLSDPEYARVYGMRADAESLNAQLEHAWHKNRLPAWGVARKTAILTFTCLAEAAWAREVWNREHQRQHAPPGEVA